MRTNDSLTSRWLLPPALAVALSLTGSAQTRDRAAVPDVYKWNLADLYPNEAAWQADKAAIAKVVPTLAQFKGKLGSSASVLADALEKASSIDRTMSKLAVYSGSLSDQDTRDAGHLAMQQQIIQMYSGFQAEASYIEPEVLRFPAGTVAKFVAAEPRLKVYRFYLEDIARRAPHTLSEPEETLLARAGVISTTPSDIFNVLSNADFPYPSVTLERRQDRQARSGGLRVAPRAAESRRPREGDVHLLQRARRLQRDAGHDDERGSAEGALLRQRAEIRVRRGSAAQRREHPGHGVHAPHRRREQIAADVPALPEAAQAHDGPRRAALLRPVRAARRIRLAQVHPRGGAETRARRRRAARRRVHVGRPARVSRSLDRSLSDRRQGLGRLLATAAPTTSTRTC